MIYAFGVALSLPMQNPPGSSLTQPAPIVSRHAEVWPLSKPTFYAATLNEVRLAEISRLQDGWYGPGSVAVTAAVLKRVRETLSVINQVRNLPSPEVTPNPNGTISLEWESSRASIFVEIGQTKMNGFIEGAAFGSVLIPELTNLRRDFQSLAEVLNPSSGMTLSHGIPSPYRDFEWTA